jgi:putative ABC transport system permease protein
MLREPRRLIASIIAIAVGVAFAAATFFLSASLEKSISAQVAGPAQGASLVVSSTYKDMVPPALITKLAKQPGVTKVHATATSIFEQKTGSGSVLLLLRELPDADSATKAVDGRMPTAKGEVAFTEAFAKARKVTVGSTLEIYSQDRSQTATLTVVGIIKPGDEYGDPSGTFAVATQDDLLRPSSYGSTGYTTAMAFGGDPTALKSSVQSMSEVTSKGLTVQTGTEYLDELKKGIKDTLSVITNFLLGFAAVALFVGALVIANTFSILVAQRSRQLALLRCVGATRSQVFRTVLGEALLMGVVGGVVGVLGGGIFAFLLVQIAKAAKLGLNDFAITPTAILVPLGIAIVITLFAALRPALRSTRVAPLAALQPQLEPTTGRRASLPVLITGAIFAVGGIAGLLYSAIKPGWTSSTNTNFIIVGVIAGFVSMVGILMIGTIIVPALAKLVGLIPARLGGVPGQLAAENSGRNPKRATATASALLIGITLISMATVGAATASATEQRAMDKQFPSDLTVTASTDISDSVLARIQKVPVVASAEKVGTGQVAINGSTDPQVVLGMGPGVRDVLRYQAYVDGLADDTILVTPEMKIAAGSMVTITGDKGTVSLRAVLPARGLSAPAVTLTALSRVSGTIAQQAWVRLTDTNDANAKIEAISSELQDVPGVQVSGGVQGREQIQQILNIVLGVVIGLLAASVLVAIVGISNTLSLSVLERTRESALLRALGLTRPQLRGMFGAEAMVLAAVGVLLGIGLGIGYGIAGSFALMSKSLSEVVVQLPWVYLLGILAFGLGAGYLASVLPSIRAGKVQPASALAAD